MFRLVRAGALALLGAGMVLSTVASAQGLRFQATDDSAPVPLTPQQLARLGDPLLRLVIRDHPGAVRLSEIEALIQPDPARRQTFVVSERIHERGGPRSARSVRAFTGQGPDGIDVNGKVFLSLFFQPGTDRFREAGPVEALAWDSERGVYNYYKLDQSPGESNLTWRFRGSSLDADQLSESERAGTCFACHINGAPVMKELLLPWNNWRAFTNEIIGLTAPIDSLRWPIAHRSSGDPRITQQLDDAFRLELIGIAAIERFNQTRLEPMKSAPDANGRITIASAERALRPLFEATEFNLISAREKSGLHPIGDNATGQPGVPVCMPNSFFVNANLIAGMNGISGLQIPEALQFQQAPSTSECGQNPLAIQSEEYRRLLERSGQSLAGVRPGDVEFAWFVPEPSFVDNDWVDLLMSEGVISAQFVAAALAVDLANPIFSDQRASLLDFLPQSITYQPLDLADPLTAGRHPDALTQAVIANLEAQQPEPASAAADWLRLLEIDDPVAELRQRVMALRSDLVAKLDPATVTPQARFAELTRLHDVARQRRGIVEEEPPLKNLVESPVLLPK